MRRFFRRFPAASGVVSAALFGTPTTSTAALGVFATLVAVAGQAEGDILVALLAFDALEAVTPPAGWTEILTADQIDSTFTGDYRIKVFTKTATGAEPADYTFTWTTPAYHDAILLAVRGTSGTNGTPTLDAPGSPGTPTVATGVTTTVKGALLLAFYTASLTSVTFSGYTAPLVEVLEFNRFAVAAGVQPGAGASGDKIATKSGSDWGSGGLIAFAPAS